MDKPVLYLAGGITGHTQEGATEWREYLTSLLLPHYTIINPMEGKRFPDGHVITANEPYPNVFEKDVESVLKSDIVLVNWLSILPGGIGTPMEAMLAWREKKLVVSIVNDHYYHHPFSFGVSDLMAYNLDQAVTMLIYYASKRVYVQT